MTLIEWARLRYGSAGVKLAVQGLSMQEIKDRLDPLPVTSDSLMVVHARPTR